MPPKEVEPVVLVSEEIGAEDGAGKMKFIFKIISN